MSFFFNRLISGGAFSFIEKDLEQLTVKCFINISGNASDHIPPEGNIDTGSF